jgi:nicotinamidase-related amidase
MQAGVRRLHPGARMLSKNADLHGNAPDKSDTALLLIDVINDLDFPEGRQVLEHALPMARRLVDLKRRAKQAGVPVVYVNDNFGKWRSNFHAQVEHCLHDDVVGRPLAELLRPDEDDYFVLKAKHSGFYSTALDLLLEHLGTKRVVLTGIAANICVLFTANDAYMRDFEVVVPGDGCASNTAEENDQAVALMSKILKADVRPCAAIEFNSANTSR